MLLLDKELWQSEWEGGGGVREYIVIAAKFYT